MSFKLTLHEEGSSWRTPDMKTASVYMYRVGGLPPEEKGWISEWNGHSHTPGSWHIKREKNGSPGAWSGEYKNANEALTVLQKEFN